MHTATRPGELAVTQPARPRSELDAQVATLADRGLTPNETEPLAGGGRRAAFIDPAGNRVAYAQPGRPGKG